MQIRAHQQLDQYVLATPSAHVPVLHQGDQKCP
jgi:hypothetical protein